MLLLCPITWLFGGISTFPTLVSVGLSFLINSPSLLGKLLGATTLAIAF